MSKNVEYFRIALLGNPNSGKSSLFNVLTGLNQRISNYPGVTIDIKMGTLIHVGGEKPIELLDFPGIYSLYPNSSDEKLVVEIITNPKDVSFPDAILFIASGIELEKHFLLATQLKELNIPMMFCLSMADLSQAKGIKYDTRAISDYLEMPVIEISTLTGVNIRKLKNELSLLVINEVKDKWKNSYRLGDEEEAVSQVVQEETGDKNKYRNLLIGHHHNWILHLKAAQRINIHAQLGQKNFNSTKFQIVETLGRFSSFTPVLSKAVKNKRETSISRTEWIDNILTHKIGGPFIFFLIMFLVFQAIYSWAEAPMTWIEKLFTMSGIWLNTLMPPGWFTNLLVDGVIAGLGGIMIFIPQIVILFFLIALLEEIGYMSRAVFMFDSIMQKFGLNGRSLVALISGGACAIPAIMSTRTIANWKERLITILVTPLISCSARIPVYTVLIAFAIPSVTIGGIFNAQGMAFMGLYLLGILAALVSAFVFKLIFTSYDRSFLMIELPLYKKPLARNIFLMVREKVMSFVTEAGKVILFISVILWFLASFGPPEKLKAAEEEAIFISFRDKLNVKEKEDLIASKKLEASYAGNLGRWIEPAIEPLGFDWKIGIALITSFAAREVFVGTMATIYSVGSTDDELSLRARMGAEINPKTGLKRFDMATSLSLLLFYAFALQCMSTLAVTRRETKSWKWPIVQFTYMGSLAYLSSFIVYQVFS